MSAHQTIFSKGALSFEAFRGRFFGTSLQENLDGTKALWNGFAGGSAEASRGRIHGQIPEGLRKDLRGRIKR